MKKNIVCISLLLLSVAANAQRIELSNIANTIAPSNMKKVEQIDVSKFFNQKFHTRPELQAFADRNKNNVYKIDNVTVCLAMGKRQLTENSAKGLQILFSKLGPTTFEKVDNKEVLITLDTLKGTTLYRFICWNQPITLQTSGLVQFEPGEQGKAKNILDKLIKNLKFKEQ